MSNKQPEELRLADRIDLKDYYEFDAELHCPKAAAELRRLHAAAGRYVTGTTNWAAAVSRYMLAAAPQPSPIKLSSDGAAAVNPETFWIPITKENMPIEGARYLLINRKAGVAFVTQFKNDGWWTHYAGLPKFKD